MPTIKLTERAINRLSAPHPDGRQTLYWDTELKGFGVLVSGKTDRKTYIVQRDLRSGRTRRVTIAPVNVLDGTGGLEQARQTAQLVLADFYQGKDPKAHRRGAASATLREVLDNYLTARKDLRENSRHDYRAAIERHLPSWLDLPLREITPDMVEERHVKIQREIAARITQKHKGRENDSSGTVQVTGKAAANGAMRTLSVLWNFAAEDNRVPDLPANPVKRLKRQWFQVGRRERMVRAEDLPKFYDAVCGLPSPTARDYVLLLLFTGLRRTEAASLRWDDIDFTERVIRLPAERTKARRKLALPMTDLVHNLLVARRQIGKEGPYVFSAASVTGHITEPRSPLDTVAEKSGVTVSAHDLRRTYITVAESADISPLALKALVNHSLGNDVTSGYVQMTAERLREPAQRVADRLRELCKIPTVTSDNVRALA